MVQNEDQFYRLLPSGFADCGECTKNWGVLFKNPRTKVSRRFLRRREEPAEDPPSFFSLHEIPLEHSLLAKGVCGTLAKAAEWHEGNALGDLQTAIATVGVTLIREMEWGRADWLPPIAAARPGDPLIEMIPEEARPFYAVDRALLSLHGLFAGYCVLALVRQARVEDGHTRAGDMFIGHSFDGDADAFAGFMLPNFDPAGQRYYWAFREDPDKATGPPILENIALGFQHPRVERAVTSSRDASEYGLDFGPEGLAGIVISQELFSRGFVSVTDVIVERSKRV